MKQANMHDAKSQLSALVDEALGGEEVIIARRGKPVVRLQVIEEPPASRRTGSLPGLLEKMPDDFDQSLEDWEESLA